MSHFHVTSARNRDSIRRHGLDWDHMGAARGVAGSQRPEQDGIFVCRDRSEAEYFVGFDSGCGPVDIWSVDGVDEGALLDNGNGYLYLPERIPASALALIDRDRTPGGLFADSGPDEAYRSTLTINLDRG